MKKHLFTLSLITFISIVTYSQQAVKVGPLGFILGNYNLRYEKGISEKGSVQVGANFYNYKLFSLKTTGFGVDAGYRYYFKEAIKGGYVAPALGFQTNTTSVSSTDNTSGSFSLLGLGATAGYQWITSGNFVVDFGLGYGYNAQLSKSEVLTRAFGG
nr:DUF3575 domain-containing protein [Saprospiraceae bacterium]